MSKAPPTTREVFDKYKIEDENGIEFLPPSFVLPALQLLGLNPSVHDVAEAVTLADVNGDGKVEFSEFESFVEQMDDSRTDPDTLLACFQMFDVSGDGELSYDEFRQALSGNGEGLAPDEVERAILLADVNKDGTIDYKEFIEYMCPGSMGGRKERRPKPKVAAPVAHKPKAASPQPTPKPHHNAPSPKKSQNDVMLSVMLQAVIDSENNERQLKVGEVHGEEETERTALFKAFKESAPKPKVVAQPAPAPKPAPEPPKAPAPVQPAPAPAAPTPAPAPKTVKPVKEKGCC